MANSPALRPAVARTIDDEPALLWLVATLGAGRLAVALATGEAFGAEPTLALVAVVAAALGGLARLGLGPARRTRRCENP